MPINKCNKIIHVLNGFSLVYLKSEHAFDENTFSQARSFEWFKFFMDGQEFVEDDNIRKVRQIIYEDRRKTINHICI